MNKQDVLNLIASGDDRIVTISHARAQSPGCVLGWRAFIESAGFDWKDSIKNGIPASQLLASGDVRSDAVVLSLYRGDIG